MAATQDGLGRVARKRGIEGHGTQEILRGNHRKMDRDIANSGKKTPKQRISIVAYMTSKIQGFSGWWIPSRDPDSPRSKLFLLSIARSASTVSKSARNHITWSLHSLLFLEKKNMPTVGQVALLESQASVTISWLWRAHWCDYFYIVYTSKGLSVERIMFDQDHWDTLREKLCYYHLSTFFQ